MPMAERERKRIDRARQKKKRPPEQQSAPARDENEVPEYIHELNRKHAVVNIGGRCFILNEVYDPVFKRTSVTFSPLSDFRAWYANKTVAVTDAKGGTQEINKAQLWLKHRARREYEGIGLFPNENPPGTYNLWRGFAEEPKQGRWDLMNEHLYENICQSSELQHTYLLNWLADLFQNPGGERPGVAVVLRGSQGTGKGCFVGQVGKILGSHFMQVTSSNHFLSRFNDHLKHALLLFADEAIWAGDRSAEGSLKGLITEDLLMIEGKGKDAFPIKNHIRVILASNNEWVVPAGMEDRRMFCLDVSSNHIQDHSYFERIRTEMDNGGRAAMLYDLLRIDLSDVNLRDIPQTESLLEQKLHTLDSVTKWWLTKLEEGRLLPSHTIWPVDGGYVPSYRLHADYNRMAKDLGFKRIEDGPLFSRKLKKVCPLIGGPYKRQEDCTWEGAPEKKRVVAYHFPPLDVCRDVFEKTIGAPIQWPRD